LASFHALALLLENGVRELKVSIISTWDKTSVEVSGLAFQGSDRPKGWGIATRPPWLLIRDIVSWGDNPRGTASLRKSPIISPTGVKTSSATITLNGANSLNFKAPEMVLWSATAIQFMPILKQRSTICSKGVRQSIE
jgi:hypothetical protein